MAKMLEKETSTSLIGANPYNRSKEWDDENKTGKPFVSADDSMAYASKPKTVMIDKMDGDKEPEKEVKEEPKEEEVLSPKETRFTKVDYKKRYDDLKRHYDKKVNEFKGYEKDLKAQIAANRPKYQPPKSAEELEEFKKDNPDIYNVVETISHMQADAQMKALQEELKEVKEAFQVEEARRAYMELKNMVPDFEQVRQDPNFHEWAEVQPKEIQDWIYNNRTNVTLAAQAINLYKASMGGVQKLPEVKVQSDNRGSADESVSVHGRIDEPEHNKKVWTTSEINALSLNQYEKVRNELDLAFSEGRVIKD